MVDFSTKNKCSFYNQAQRHRIKEKKNQEPIQWARLFKKLLILIFIGGIGAALLLGVWKLRQYNDVPIEKVQVVATYNHLDPQVLQKIISHHITGSLFSLDVINLRQDILAVPWVQDTAVKRKWPNTIIINIVEHQPIAQWKSSALLASNGMLFTPDPKTFPSGLPLLLGPEEEVDEIVAKYQKMQKLLQPLNFTITQLDLNEHYSWHMILNKSIDVYLGSEDPMAKLQNFIAAYPKIIETYPGRAVNSLDLRYKNGVAVRWYEKKGATK